MRGTIHLIGDDVTTSSVVERELAAHYRVLTYCSVRQLLERLPDERGPGCVILDLASPGLAGPQLRAAMAKVGSTLPIMFLTKSAKDMFLTKSAKDWRRGPPTEFRRLAREIMKAMKLQEKEDMGEMAMLTPAQKKLLRHFAKGNSDGQIAQELSVKESVIAEQRAKMKVTLQVHSQAHFKAIADLLAFGQAGNKSLGSTPESNNMSPHIRGIFHQVDRLESLGDHGQHDAAPRS